MARYWACQKGIESALLYFQYFSTKFKIIKNNPLLNKSASKVNEFMLLNP
ncbi:hypothetical protein SAMN04488029_2420 [Reichenbachiella faecimaris]|uniref:Uncharacterized protein n=1 Tax=Reichenbachiella faecimaris TaxID=692418 RepID=A0A1W2GF31_REIFA|nr:hypothetical protein SAMN04488029_2420 [Reichenbachiella faecimaris]